MSSPEEVFAYIAGQIDGLSCFIGLIIGYALGR